jgi:hypothetical protein
VRGPLVAALALGLALALPPIALAHDDLDAALRHYERAEFARAVSAFDRAEASDHLTREELETLLRGRGLAHHAAGDEGAAEEDLATWLSLAPTASLDDTTPPAVRRLFERLRGEAVALDVEASVVPTSTGFGISARVVGDVGHLTRTVRIHYRTTAGTDVVEGARADVLSSDATLAYWIEVVGPGGASLATAGSEAGPLEHRRDSIAAAAEPAGPPITGGDDTGVIVGVTVTAVVVVAAVAVVLALVLAPPPDTTLSGPMRVEM